ncbi:MAG: AAA family ATPase [Hyphomonadaceae bacterium]
MTDTKRRSPNDELDLSDDLDLDLDMDAPIGASFAAALRGTDDAQKRPLLPDDEEDIATLLSRYSNEMGEIPVVPDESEFSLEREFGDAPFSATGAADPAAFDGPAMLDEDLASAVDDDFATGAPADDYAPEISAEGGGFEEADPAAATYTDDAYAEESDLDETEANETAFEAADPADAFGEEPFEMDASEDGISEVEAEDSLDAAPDLDDAEPPLAEDEAAGQGLGFDYDFEHGPAGGDRIIPRIIIHAFTARSSQTQLMESARRDRRMKNVTLEIREGGIPAAIDYYINETTPNLLILEASGDPRQLLGQIDSLAQYCDEGVRVIVLGDTNDIRFYRELMNRGVSEYLVLPVQPLQLIRAISGLFSDPDTPFTGKTLAVTGVKGGVGASTLAHNLAWSLTERVKVSATLVDLDLNFGTTGLDFNQDTPATIADALMSPERFDDAVMGRLITRATERLSLFTAPATLDRTYDLHPETYVEVLERVRESVPFVVLDLPHIWSDWFKSTIMTADEVVVVAGPDLASLRNGKNLIDFLKAARSNDAPPRLVLNMVGLPKRPEIPPKDFGQAIGIEPSMIVPFDAQLFGTAANNGQMVFDVAPESKIAQGIDQLASILTGHEVQATKPSILKKILGR